MRMSPHKIRTLQSLLAKNCTSRELMIEVGCQNPPDVVQLLRKDHGIDILCPLIPFRNRDGKDIKIGLYQIPECERGKAEKLLLGTAIPNSGTVNNLAKQSTEGTIISQ